MTWIYAVILAISAGLCTLVLARSVARLAALLGLEVPSHDVMSYAAFSALAFLMVAQAPAMVLTSALVLWIAGVRDTKKPLSITVRAGLIVLATLLGIAALGTPNFQLPEQLPKAAIMFAIYVVWCAISTLPLGEPRHGLFASYAVALLIFVVGTVALQLPVSLAGDAIVMGGALAGAFVGLTAANAHQTLVGQWVFLYLLGFFAATAAYEGVWWLGLLGILPLALYTLVRQRV
jgi:hypothetical protein